MTTTLNLKTLFILALIALLAYLAIIPGLANIPLSDHAKNEHKNQKWNAASILTTINNGGCGQVDVYACSNDTLIYTCQSPSDPTKLLGLVVGQTVKQVITGYSSRASHWNKKTGKCDYLGPASFAQ